MSSEWHSAGPIDWSALEETPVERTGNRAFCYTCNMDLRPRSDSEAVRTTYSTFFITLCVWCYHDIRHMKP